MIKLKDILNEDDVTDAFGKVAFGSDMDLVRMQGAIAGEKNTKYETELLQALESWVKGSDREDTEIANLLHRKFPLLKKAAKVFPKLLLPETPNGTTVYRGLDSPNQKLWDTINKTSIDDWEKWKIGWVNLYRYKKPIKYTPHKKVQSWSTRLQTAFGFTLGVQEAVFLSTKQTDEFLFNENLLNYLFSGGDEREILHFGKTYNEDVYVSIDSKKWNKIFGKEKRRKTI